MVKSSTKSADELAVAIQKVSSKIHLLKKIKKKFSVALPLTPDGFAEIEKKLSGNSEMMEELKHLIGEEVADQERFKGCVSSILEKLMFGVEKSYYCPEKNGNQQSFSSACPLICYVIVTALNFEFGLDPSKNEVMDDIQSHFSS